MRHHDFLHLLHRLRLELADALGGNLELGRKVVQRGAILFLLLPLVLYLLDQSLVSENTFAAMRGFTSNCLSS